MAFLPFDSLVIANQDFELQSVKDTLSFFSSCGIRKFIFLINFDRSRHTVAWIKDRKKLLDRLIDSVRPGGVFVQSFLNLELSEGIIYDPTVDRLLSKHSSFLFVKAPLFCDESWVDADLNHLLYKKKLIPILSSFEGNISTNSKSRIDQIFTSNAYWLSLDLNYLTAKDSELRIKQIISREIHILPCITHSLSNYAGILNAFDNMKTRYGSNLYTRMNRNLLGTQNYFHPYHHYCTK